MCDLDHGNIPPLCSTANADETAFERREVVAVALEQAAAIGNEIERVQAAGTLDELQSFALDLDRDKNVRPFINRDSPDDHSRSTVA